MLMPPTLSEMGLPFQPKTSDRRSGAAAERSPARSALVLTRISQTKHACGRPTISILNALLFSRFSTDFSCVSHEKPRISQMHKRHFVSPFLDTIEKLDAFALRK
jgi:hypothetical protein